MLGKLRRYLWNHKDTPVLDPGLKPHRVEGPLCLVADGRPIELRLGKQRLHIRPEVGVAPGPGSGRKDLILVDPERYDTEVAGFERLKPGEKIMVGRDNIRLDKIFNFPKSSSK